MNNKKQISKYVAGDMISAITSWYLFYSFFTEKYPGPAISHVEPAESDYYFVSGAILFTAFWLLFLRMRGFYREPFRRSRLKELGASIMTTISGSLIINIILIALNLIPGELNIYFNCFLVLCYIYFPLSYIPRLLITSKTISDIRKGKIGFNTLIIGSDKKAVDIYNEIKQQIRSTGNIFTGFINTNGNSSCPMSAVLPNLGGLERLNQIIAEYEVREVIIAIESTEHDKIDSIINKLDQPGIEIKALPGMHDILTGRVKINTILETPLIHLSHTFMPPWQQNLKQIIDIVFSLSAIIILIPLSTVIMIWIKLSSKGPVIYSHERIGKNGKPFRIYKFRTMIDNAEKNGPELSSGNDARITKPGRFLRKTRLDEIPNFINVLKGDMSIVGPRPERKYYIDKIVTQAPHYKHLLKIKPGITSWGQVKFGYAGSVDEMIQRLKYDIIYLENMSVFVDFQIMILTFLIIFKRKGV